MKYLFIVLLSIITVHVGAQEICDNGIDDNGDGLIDLNDPECFCIGNYVTNGTFDGPCQDYPIGWSSGFNTNYATSTICDQNNICNGNTPPPAPATEFFQITTSGIIGSANVYQCLTTPLTAGVTYTLTYDYSICSGPLQIQNPPQFSDIYFFGIIDCPADYEFDSWFCAQNYSGPMQMLDQHSFAPVWFTWFNYSLTFTPTEDLEGIAFSGPCWNGSANVELIYTNLTNIVISADPVQDLLRPILSIGSECGEWIATADLSNVTVPNPTIQWYLDGVAISGATNLTYIIPPGTTGLISYALTNSPECGTSDEVDIPIVPEVNVTGNQTDNLCFGDADGSIQLEVVSGTPPYTYLWSNGSTTADLVDLPAGSYTVAVTDSLGCSDEVTFIIAQPDQPVGGNVVEILPVDPSTGVGSATVTGTGGTPTYSYQWSNGEMTSTASGLFPGTHTVIITDVNGCETSVTIEIPIQPLTVNVFADPSCPNACNGQLLITVEGGLEPYNISWTGGLMGTNPTDVCQGLYNLMVTDAQQSLVDTIVEVEGLPLIFIESQIVRPACGVPESGEIFLSAFGEAPFNYLWFDGSTDSGIPDLDPGTYAVTVTDGNGCSLDTSFILNPSGGYEVQASIIPISCPNDSNGQITLTIAGAPISNFDFNWSTGTSGNVLSGIGTGIYFVTIGDSDGDCAEIRSYEIESPDFGTILINGETSACAGEILPVEIASADSINVFSIHWNDGDTLFTKSFDSAGVYTFSVTDSNGCTKDSSVEIAFLDLPGIAVTVDQIDCIGDDTLGQIQILNTVDSLPLRVIWSTGDTTSILQDIGPGTYRANVANAAGCSIDTSMTLRPNALSYEIMGADSICADSLGEIFIMSSMIDALDILWSTGDTTNTISNLSAGQYAVTVSNSDGCSISEIFDIAAFPSIILNIQSSDESCAGASDGSISLNPGNDSYMIQWNDGQTGTERTNLSPGAYGVGVTDINGCFVRDSFTINTGFNFVPEFQIQRPNCAGDTTLVSIPGLIPTNDYAIEWTDGSTLTNRIFTSDGSYGVSITYLPANCVFDTLFEFTTKAFGNIDANIVPASCSISNGTIDLLGSDLGALNIQWSSGDSGSSINNLAPGAYDVTIVDALGCDTILSLEVLEIPVTSFLISSADVSCNGDQTGAITIDPASAFQGIIINGVVAGAENANLFAGSYEIDLLDTSGCTFNEMVTIAEPDDPLVIILDTIIQDLSGMGSGSISISGVGGTPLYTYQWSNGQNGPSINNLDAGTFAVTVIDSNGCTTESEYTIITDPLIVSVGAEDVDCRGNCTGAISIDIFGGTRPYDIQLRSSDKSLVDTIALCAGNYNLLVTDAGGQVFELNNIEIIEPIEDFTVSIQSFEDTIFIDDIGITELTANIDDPSEINTLEWFQNGESVCLGDPSSCASVVLEVNDTDFVVLRTESIDGCVSLDTVWLVRLTETLPPRVFIPNVIRLSNTSVNRIWTVYPSGDITIHNVAIYDRWGNSIYSRSNGEVSWDGTANGEEVVPGVYVYTISYSFTEKGPLVNRSGDITVLP